MMRCKCCDKIMQHQDFEFISEIQDYDDMCLRCRHMTWAADPDDVEVIEVRPDSDE